MSTLTLSQPFHLSPFSSEERTNVDPDVYRLDRPTVIKLNNIYIYGNLCLLRGQRFSVEVSSEPLQKLSRTPFLSDELMAGQILVTPLYKPQHEEIATIPLRWGCPRIVVLHAGFRYFMGQSLDKELCPTCRRWRYCGVHPCRRNFTLSIFSGSSAEKRLSSNCRSSCQLTGT